MNIGIDALMIDDKPTGIGWYGINLINSIDKVVDQSLNINVYIQEKAKMYFKDINNINLKIVGNFKSNKERICYQQIKMASIFKKDKIDFVHFIDYLIPIFFNKIPYVITIHDLSFYEKNFFNISKSLFKRIITKISINRSKAIICDSNWTKKCIEDKFNITDKVYTVYLGYDKIYKRLKVQDERIMDNIRNKYRIKNKYILFVGTIEPRKNLYNLIKAFNKISKSVEHQLIVVGKKGWMFENVLKLVENLKLENKIIFTDYIDNVEMLYLYNNADISVYPSIYEGFGIPPLEAMACGSPVVVSNVTSLPEVVGDAALLVDPFNVDDIADKIYKVISDRNLNNTLREKSVIQANKFSWGKCAMETLDIYLKVGGLKDEFN
ncbi:glycosyltransferase family 4 protein [Thermoanaerobacterium thermosaccharolyticum]|uniref:glycosyltransferase family 4 protein n=1 Tax=Thermoanaerobacterium thermosaccharolyticum TaxID=1517 RepID=UPI00177F276D|nr:glycosyltransferase family 1 protein [Thermoanaerobacterium thermosaccharolyticum]MBE0069263.1 glycosyltransferase family 4 protein [Thermoanaerobacterium thermosaccharolyticum]MBE0229049.1 glycosyltransferase family 4 protein [Thermoanaerobacterium thermosaccharolyticum]